MLHKCVVKTAGRFHRPERGQGAGAGVAVRAGPARRGAPVQGTAWKKGAWIRTGCDFESQDQSGSLGAPREALLPA